MAFAGLKKQINKANQVRIEIVMNLPSVAFEFKWVTVMGKRDCKCLEVSAFTLITAELGQ